MEEVDLGVKVDRLWGACQWAAACQSGVGQLTSGLQHAAPMLTEVALTAKAGLCGYGGVSGKGVKRR